MNTSRYKILTALSVLFLFIISSCQENDDCENNRVEHSHYYVMNIKEKISPGKILLDVKSYQQTTEYTCGPSAVISLLNYLGMQGDEMTIATEMGTSSSTGTTPEQMTGWLNNHGFNASWNENGSLELLRENLKNNIPTLVEWSDWGGHWVLVIGYDTRDTEDTMDDVIIFADPYDRHDDNLDGITWFHAERFYYMWYDALLFGRVMRRVYISAVPN